MQYVKYEKSLYPEQVLRRIGKQVWVTIPYTQFWRDITKGKYKIISDVKKVKSTDVVFFEDGTKLRLQDLGSIWVAFDEKPTKNTTDYRVGRNLRECREAVSKYPF